MPTIQELAKDFSRRFEGATRDDGTKYRRVKDGEQTEELQALIFAAHDAGGMLPDDWRYQFIEEALDAISEDGEDAQLEPSIYTHELTGWLHSRADRYGYCDEAIGEYGVMSGDVKPTGMIQLLTWGMAQEQQEVLSSVLASLEKLVEEMEEAA
jgi:hypothetical protein